MALKKRVQDNTSVVKSNSDKSETVIKNGNHVDNTKKIDLKKESCSCTTIGISIGGTFNMDNYESLRVDTWISDTVKEGETVEEAYNRLRGIVSAQLTTTVSEYTK